MAGCDRREFLRTASQLAASAFIARAARGQDSRPNILFVLVDDLGKEWVSCYGAEEVETPHVDGLAAGGMRFDNAYCMPQCTPTRATFLTGQYPFRHGWVNHWDVPRWGGGCHFDPAANPCVARSLRAAGYRTAVAGKWQLNDFRLQPNVLDDLGFDDWCMWTGGEGGNPPSNERYWDPYVHTRAGSRTVAGKFGPDIYADFLIDQLRQQHDRPQFLYWSMCLTHHPLVATPLEPEAKTNREKHIAMVHYTDYLLGRMLQALDETGQRERTIIVWTADNGTGGIAGRRNGRVVQGGKAKTTEPGICMPFIVNGPGVPRGRATDALTDFTDLYPTFCQLGGASLPADIVQDGSSIADLVQGRADDSTRSWILAMGGQNRAKRTDQGVENEWYFRDRVLRDKRFKVTIGTDRQPQKLIDLLADPEEQHDLLPAPDVDAGAALARFSAVVAAQPEQDADPHYTPLPAQPWDVPVKAESQVWKLGRP